MSIQTFFDNVWTNALLALSIISTYYVLRFYLNRDKYLSATKRTLLIVVALCYVTHSDKILVKLVMPIMMMLIQAPHIRLVTICVVELVMGLYALTLWFEPEYIAYSCVVALVPIFATAHTLPDTKSVCLTLFCMGVSHVLRVIGVSQVCMFAIVPVLCWYAYDIATIAMTEQNWLD